MLQTFCIPIIGLPDADSETHRLSSASANLEPVQGWEQWTADLVEVASKCETAEALDRLQTTYRNELRTVSKARNDLYARVGGAIRSRRTALARPASSTPPLPDTALNQSPPQTETSLAQPRQGRRTHEELNGTAHHA